MTVRIKASQAVTVRTTLLKQQGYKCPLCEQSMTAAANKTPALDHDHATGYLRDVLCINCNGMEGRVFSLARRARAKGTEYEWLARLLRYYERHITPQHGGVFHHTHKTAEELRLARNAKARVKRAALKA
jgi:hypothetical protein